jgi:chromate transporter
MDRPRLRSFFGLALKLGFTGFGGGYAVAQQIRRAVVDEHEWLDDEGFVEALAVASSLPGTTATNLLTLIGYRFGGIRAAAGAAAAFLAPSVALMVVFGAAYARLRHLPALGTVLDGMGAATVGVIGAVAVDMRRLAIRGQLAWIIAAAAAGLLIVNAVNLLEVIALAGLIGAIWMRPKELRSPLPPENDARGSLGGLLLAIPPVAAMPAVVALLFVFARIGVATFGGGIAMISPMEQEVVHVRGWLDDDAFRDAIVLGQITPGPIAISATFIGYRVAGALGAAVATLAMFGPPFVLAIAAARSMDAFRRSPAVAGFLAAVAPAVVGAIAAACVALFHTAVHGFRQGAVAAAVFALLVARPRLSPLLPIAAAGALEALLA